MSGTVLPALAVAMSAAAGASADDALVTVFDAVPIEYDESLTEPIRRGGHAVRDGGQTVERTVDLPPAPADQRDARRIVATVTVAPAMTVAAGRRRPGDEWTRVGSLSVALPSGEQGPPVEVELVRFTTGFGGEGTFTQDVTALAPLLHGRATLRLFISTYRKPAWRVGVTLLYTEEGVGYRRPVFAEPLFEGPRLATADEPRLQAAVEIPAGLARPRLRVITTGHATDGGPENEFISCTHVLRVDGREIARWRPWSEGGGTLRARNPWAGRRTIDGREFWSSDLDRTGWRPGAVVEPLVLPVPELTAGRHEIDLEVLGIRPEGADHAHGYWRISAVVVADEPWPAGPGPGR